MFWLSFLNRCLIFFSCDSEPSHSFDMAKIEDFGFIPPDGMTAEF